MMENTLEKSLKVMRSLLEKKMRRLDDADLDILQTLLLSGSQRQYQLEKNLREKLHKSIAHSSFSSKLQKLSNYSLVEFEKKNGGKYYKITPLGFGFLLMHGKITLDNLLTYVERNPKQVWELISIYRPRLAEKMMTWPLWSTVPLTEYLYAYFNIADRPQIRFQTLKSLLVDKQKIKNFIRMPNLHFELRCSKNFHIKGEDFCLIKREKCKYAPSEFAKCEIIQRQIQKEINILENRMRQSGQGR